MICGKCRSPGPTPDLLSTQRSELGQVLQGIWTHTNVWEPWPYIWSCLLKQPLLLDSRDVVISSSPFQWKFWFLGTEKQPFRFLLFSLSFLNENNSQWNNVFAWPSLTSTGSVAAGGEMQRGKRVEYCCFEAPKSVLTPWVPYLLSRTHMLASQQAPWRALGLGSQRSHPSSHLSSSKHVPSILGYNHEQVLWASALGYSCHYGGPQLKARGLRSNW